MIRYLKYKNKDTKNNNRKYNKIVYLKNFIKKVIKKI
jgi:hypothetical protein